ncbi:MAG: helix-turn-helix domain-containing protein [Deltaproteobacteria bacterium]|nr:helix-turn-helix domain-containing protein [Deltaproteobacteria bacterium]
MQRERLLRPREVAHRLGISRSSVYRWFWEGKLRGVKLLGGPVRILESSVKLQLSEADFGLD